MAKKVTQSDEDSDEKDKNSKTLYSLKDLPGVGDATIKKLNDAGIVSIRTLA
ncbi:unnamed protein product, partial [marine sediment metagenome]